MQEKGLADGAQLLRLQAKMPTNSGVFRDMIKANKDFLDLIENEVGFAITMHVGTGWIEPDIDVLRAIKKHYERTGESLLEAYSDLIAWHDKKFVKYKGSGNISIKEAYETIDRIKSLRQLDLLREEYIKESLHNIMTTSSSEKK